MEEEAHFVYQETYGAGSEEQGKIVQEGRNSVSAPPGFDYVGIFSTCRKALKLTLRQSQLKKHVIMETINRLSAYSSRGIPGAVEAAWDGDIEVLEFMISHKIWDTNLPMTRIDGSRYYLSTESVMAHVLRHMAFTSSDDPKVVEFLAQRGYIQFLTDEDFVDFLKYGKTKMIRVLLNYGFHPNKNSPRPIAAAIISRNLDLISYLESNGYKFPKLSELSQELAKYPQGTVNQVVQFYIKVLSH